MNAIIPINVAAIRVNQNDLTNIVNGFKGRTALFEQLPWQSTSTQASTGDTIYQPFQANQGPADPLRAGIHIHWELPDYFRRGAQPASDSQPGGAGAVVFPHAPNRWLVLRYFSQFDPGMQEWGPIAPKAFLIESDYLSISPPNRPRPVVSVPLPLNPQPNTQPFLFMGRVLNYEDWNPAAEDPKQFLPGFTASDPTPRYLTSVGFVGPGFSSYYPECASVFGFWDSFSDLPAVSQAIANNSPIQFKASYQVIGWINEQATDPLSGIAATVTTQYNAYVAQKKSLKLKVTKTPADFFQTVAQSIAPSWVFNPKDIQYTLNSDCTINTLTVPTGTLCSGVVQEVVWNMLQNTGTTYFLNNPDAPTQPSGTWTDTVELAVGNSTVEALSALLKKDMGNNDNDPNVLKNYEYLLDALQLGLLRGLEGQDDKIILLDEALHSKAFSTLSGGQLWSVREKESASTDTEVTLPLDLAERLYLLNQAQKNYDQARASLDAKRKQLFMDWLRYVKLYVPQLNEAYLTWTQIQDFLSLSGGGGEVSAVIQAGQTTGIVTYQQDPVTGQVTAINPPTPGSNLANTLYAQYNAFLVALAPYSGYELLCSPAPPFCIPSDPVLLMEGDRIQPVRRNGATGTVGVRLSNELFTNLGIQYNGNSFIIPASSLAGVPSITSVTPMQSDVQALVAESYLLVLSMASICADALKTQGGTNNPAVSDYANFVLSLQNSQGGFSPLENNPASGLFGTIRQPGYKPVVNPVQNVSTPLALVVTFSNATSSGWAPDSVGWNTQSAVPGFPASRVDPFLPVFLMWDANLRPLNWKDASPGLMNYSADNLTSYFELTSDAVDYQYLMQNGTPVNFTAANAATYTGSVVLSKKPVFSLTAQIDNYVDNYPTDPADTTLEAIKSMYIGRPIMSQALSDFSVQQTLRSYIPQITVEDLVMGTQDAVTRAINKAAIASKADNWYTWNFNSVSPISTQLLAQLNFGPLRGGFMEVRSLTIVDVFGQIMQLSTATTTPDGSMQTIPAISMQPRDGDTVNKDWIYLPPRLLVPSRLWFRWLSAAHNDDVSGVSTDFVEMNSHPATSPITGWVLPNHLDNSLFFYQSAGAPIGSFGIEAGKLKYRTRAGNQHNVNDILAYDIGDPGSPTVNPHLANFMWYVNDTGSAVAAI